MRSGTITYMREQPQKSRQHCIGLSRGTFRIQKALAVEFLSTDSMLAPATESILAKMVSVL